MSPEAKLVHNAHACSGVPAAAWPFALEQAERVRAFHAEIEGYAPTPLVSLKALAGKLGISRLWVKDESARFGLNAFKVLGGSYAVAYELADGDDNPSFAKLIAEGAGRGRVFVTATDGNHGRGVAWACARMGAQAVVYMPAGSSSERLKNIQTLGAHAKILDMDYDDAVEYAADQAQRNGWSLLQDTSWEGYEDVPRRIMQGYTSLALEAVEQLGQLGEGVPTHVFLQAGVGAMAGAVAGFLVEYYGSNRPRIVVVEPLGAACLFRTAEVGDGAIHRAGLPLDTIMAGLSCGVPCGIGWEVLHEVADDFLAIPDSAAEDAMRLLAHPMDDDQVIVSDESGVAGVAALATVLRCGLSDALGLDGDSRVLCISTEGATDRESYERIVGALPANG